MATLRAEIIGMKVGATKVYRMQRQSRNSLCALCSLLKRQLGQVYHVTSDWDNKILVVTRES